MALERLGKTKIKEPKVLVVEGEDEVHFFNALIEDLELESIDVIHTYGKTDYWSKVKAIVGSPGFSDTVTSLCLVRDANNDPDATFDSICGALNAADLRAPTEPFVIVDGDIQVAVVILPGKGRCGELEDLCLQAVQDNPAMGCVEEFFACLEEGGLSLPRKLSKAKVQVFLASKEKVVLGVGTAAKKGYLPLAANCFEEIRTFLQTLAS